MEFPLPAVLTKVPVLFTVPAAPAERCNTVPSAVTANVPLLSSTAPLFKYNGEPLQLIWPWLSNVRPFKDL